MARSGLNRESGWWADRIEGSCETPQGGYADEHDDTRRKDRGGQQRGGR